MPKDKYTQLVNNDVLTIIRGWARDGMTDAEIAEHMHISKHSFYKWMKLHEEFANAVIEGRRPVLVEVEDTFYDKKLKGYYVTETTKEKTVQRNTNGEITGTVEHVRENERYIPPDTTAIIFYLKCRMRNKYNETPNSKLIENKLRKEITLLEKRIEAISGADTAALDKLDKILDDVQKTAESGAESAGETEDKTNEESEDSENV